ncbi:MAG: tRNA dihydrouridine synthase DusB [Clostridia bacterium]|nr:tRNA dihydrouridine synthase DusB [Clostridia bacterium]
MRIGNLTFDNNIFLAPMAGVTDLAFRIICKRWGAGLVYSEMVSSKAMHYDDKKTFSLMETAEEEAPMAVQIFGSDPHIMAESAKKIENMGVPLIDINMGCPAPKVAKNGDGSSLLKDFKLIGDIVKSVSSAVSIPVTCKVRCGINECIDMAELAKVIEDCGAAAITVHGRTAAMYYSGKADRNKITQVKRAVTIPVIGNGDIFSAEDAASMFEETGCDGVMVARGAQGNPFIFRQIREYMENSEVVTVPDDVERLSVMKEHISLLINLKGERTGVKEARKHVAWYTKGMHGGASVRNEVCKTESYDELMNIIDEYIKILRR